MRKILAVVTASLVAACARGPSIDVDTNVVCPQPAAAALSPPVPLPRVPDLPGTDPASVVGELSAILALDTDIHGDEVDKRETLIDHGVRLCGWTR